MPEIRIKKGPTWELRALYEDGKVLLYLRSNEGGGDYGHSPSYFLSAEEWDAFAAWIDWQRAKELAFSGAIEEE